MNLLKSNQSNDSSEFSSTNSFHWKITVKKSMNNPGEICREQCQHSKSKKEALSKGWDCEAATITPHQNENLPKINYDF